MDENTVFEAIEKLAQSLLSRDDMQERGLVLKSLKVATGRNALVRVYLDKENGVSIGDCTYFHKEFSVMLDVENIMIGPCRLEVSSPGIDTK